MATQLASRGRSGKSTVAALVFLACFLALVVFIGFYYLVPAFEATRNASPREKKGFAAVTFLILAILLFGLIMGLIITFGLGRFFFPRKSPPRTQTPYVDAWKESANRLAAPPSDDDAPPPSGGARPPAPDED